MRGPGVIGAYPVLKPGTEEEPFVYRSRSGKLRLDPSRPGYGMPLPSRRFGDQAKLWPFVGEMPIPARMEGDFTFVEGTLARPEGAEFDALCGTLVLDLEPFVY